MSHNIPHTDVLRPECHAEACQIQDISSETKLTLFPRIFPYSQTVLVDVEGGCEGPLAGHPADVAAGPELVALLEAEGAVDEGGEVHEVDAAEGLVRVGDLAGVRERVDEGLHEDVAASIGQSQAALHALFQ